MENYIWKDDGLVFLTIKNILKRVLPPPVNTFYREINRVSSSIDRINTQIKSANERIAQHEERELKEISKRFIILENQMNTVSGELSNCRKILWNNPPERRRAIADWKDEIEASDFEERFLKLIRGLDGESVLILTRALSRIQKYMQEEENKELDLFTRAEQEELRLLQEEFYDNIFKVSDHLYVYKNYLLPKNHFEASVFYYKHGIDELKTVDRVEGKAIIDVGGFIGDSILALSDLNPSKIYTFEAHPQNFEYLKRTIQLNNISNVVAENVALGAEKGTMTLYSYGGASTAVKSGAISYKDEFAVPVISLDEYVDMHHIQVGLIKVDIEGAEPYFLEGAKRTICEQKPILLLSIYHNAHDFLELKPMIESWNLGYTFRIHKPTISNTVGEMLLLAEVEQI